MSSVITDRNGRTRILFKRYDGKRATLRIGKQPQELIRLYDEMVNHLNACHHAQQLIAPRILEAAAELPAWLYDRFADCGLLPPRDKDAEHSEAVRTVTLEAFLARLFATFTVKPATLTNYNHTARCLMDHFGKELGLRRLDVAGREVDSIGEEEASRFVAYLSKTLSRATVGRRIISARHFFKKAVKWGYVASNPFADVKAAAQRNEKRKFFVSRDVTQRILDACPNIEWKVIVALARYGGLRVPSELYPLRLTDLNFERGEILVRSPKTEHHAGKESRIVPMFPELEPILLRVVAEAAPGQEYVITRYREGNANLRTQFGRILDKAGVPAWPRLFQNLRASRETELFRDFPIEDACRWIGNSPQVAVVHYLNSPDKDAQFQRAIGRGAETGGANSGAPSGDGPRVPTQRICGNQPETTNLEGEAALAGGGVWAIQDSNL